MTVKYFGLEIICIYISLKEKRNTKLLLYQVLNFQKVNNFTAFRLKILYRFFSNPNFLTNIS
jgi:hypothetical protein